jgi:chromosome segregation ATPase
VAQAAEALAAEGTNPTLRSIRERLQSGSPNTIHRHFAHWQESRKRARQPAEIPKAIADAIASELDKAWQRGKSESHQDLETEQASSQELRALADRLEQELTDERAKSIAIATQRDKLQGQLEQKDIELAAARQSAETERSASEAARIECAKTALKCEMLEARIFELAAENERLTQEYNAKRQSAADLREQIARLEEQTKANSKPQAKTTANKTTKSQTTSAARKHRQPIPDKPT